MQFEEISQRRKHRYQERYVNIKITWAYSNEYAQVILFHCREFFFVLGIGIFHIRVVQKAIGQHIIGINISNERPHPKTFRPPCFTDGYYFPLQVVLVSFFQTLSRSPSLSLRFSSSLFFSLPKPPLLDRGALSLFSGWHKRARQPINAYR